MANPLSSRWMHNTILMVMVGVIILVPPDVLPRSEIIAASFVLFAWVLGEYYERSLVIEAGLVDPEELKTVERSNRGWLNLWD